MILLDTNVISEFMREAPDPTVVAWLDRQPEGSIWTTSVTVFELEFGLRSLEKGKRRDRLETALRTIFDEELDGRILPFDIEAAVIAGELAAELKSTGGPLDIRDVQIASVARAHGAKVATRNERHFARSCEVVNPWNAS